MFCMRPYTDRQTEGCEVADWVNKVAGVQCSEPQQKQRDVN